MDKILVQICSYRDIHLISTVKDLFNKASEPSRLRVVIACQRDTNEDIDELKAMPNVTVIDIYYKDTKGVGWARNLLQRQYNDEKYVLQLDSHHKFVQDWDAMCIKMIEDLQNKGYSKPMLTTYLPDYNETTGDLSTTAPTKMTFCNFEKNGLIAFAYTEVKDYNKLTLPERARFYSGHFVFTLGKWDLEVLYDPDCWSIFAEELNMGVRSYTHGYDLFHPHKLIAYHCYSRSSRWAHHYDVDNLDERLDQSASRLRQLLYVDNVDFGIYGVGKFRSIKDYENYTGIDFKNKSTIQRINYTPLPHI